MAMTIFNHTHPTIIEVTFSFSEFVSAFKKLVYSINSFLTSNQFQSPVTRVATPIFDHACSKLKTNLKFLWICIVSGITLETEGSYWQRYKRALFPYKEIMKGHFWFEQPLVYITFILLLIKKVSKK